MTSPIMKNGQDVLIVNLESGTVRVNIPCQVPASVKYKSKNIQHRTKKYINTKPVMIYMKSSTASGRLCGYRVRLPCDRSLHGL